MSKVKIASTQSANWAMFGGAIGFVINTNPFPPILLVIQLESCSIR